MADANSAPLTMGPPPGMPVFMQQGMMDPSMMQGMPGTMQMVPQLQPQQQQQQLEQRVPHASPAMYSMLPPGYAQPIGAGMMPPQMLGEGAMPMVPQPGPSGQSQPNTPSVVASPTTFPPGTLKRRRFSGAKIQPTRVKKVMQSDEEIGRMVASVPVAIGRAMEHFAEKFLAASAQAVAGSGARTLGPQHMKMAMLSNPHFAFLDTILKDVAAPPGFQPPPQPPTMAAPDEQQKLWIQQQIQLGRLPPMPEGAMQQMMMGQYQSMVNSTVMGGPPTLASPTAPAAPAPRTTRRSSSSVSNGEGGGQTTTGEKRPRGRPRKVKKDKCVEDDLVVDTSMATTGLLAAPSPGDVKPDTNDADRALMPPPPMLPMRVNPPPPPPSSS